MKCPHCRVEFFSEHLKTILEKPYKPVMKGGPFDGKELYIYSNITTCPSCSGATIDVTLESAVTDQKFKVIRAYPRSGPYASAPLEVPANIAADYGEANEVLSISPKASAALSRRCLQAILAAHGYQGRDLVGQIEAVLSEGDSSKALPTALRENIDAIRNFGNFSAHPITDQTTLQIVDVEAGEAEWCLEILLDLFDHYYVAPAKAAAKRMALSTKLAAAGKPPMKG